VFYSARCGYFLGLVAAMAALSWFMWLEQILVRNLTNTSIAFNLPDEGLSDIGEIIVFAGWRILAMALIVVALACAGLRLLPASWKLRKSNISNRTWPAVALSLILLATWYGSSVSPYAYRISSMLLGWM